jgi:hypothetical protein
MVVWMTARLRLRGYMYIGWVRTFMAVPPPDRDSNRSDRLQVISTELDYDYEELEWITRCRLSGVMSSARVDVFSPVSLQTIRTTTDVQVTSDGFLSRVEDFARDEGVIMSS